MLGIHKQSIQLAIKKAFGTLKKVESMVEDEAYCADVAQQVNAVIGLLKNVNNQLLENHLKCCGAKKLLSKNTKEVDEFVKELVRVWDVSTRK